MHEDAKKSDRDHALIGVLTRLAEEMQEQDKMLADVISRQTNLGKGLEATEQYIRRKQIEVDEAHNKMMDSFHHYRSDMLKLVNEQDTINRNISDLQSVVKTTTFTLDNTNHMLTALDERLSRLEKVTGEQIAHTMKQHGSLQEALDESGREVARLHTETEKRIDGFHRETAEQLDKSSRDFSKLHADTEKRIDDFHKDTLEQLDKFQYETTRRLLLLDSIVNSIQTLLVRTDPELKKKPWIVRVFKRISTFFRFKLPFLLKKNKFE
ncbi:MAG: hypothetical protein FWC20_12735 [Oscillospiraceae bacterium]|nr:hypothetical protein [Oscillospiraceae bacterium]